MNINIIGNIIYYHKKPFIQIIQKNTFDSADWPVGF